MSRQREKSQETINELIQSAKVEFLLHGYQKASLRTICKNAGLTTGAMYFFFEDKDTLFCEVTREAVEDIGRLIQSHVQEESNSFGQGIKLERNADVQLGKDIVSYACRHKDECKLLLEKAKGSSRENFIDEVVEMVHRVFQNMIQQYGQLYDIEHIEEVFNECTVHWLSYVQADAYLHIISHDLEEKEALRQVEIVAEFLLGGYEELLRLAKKRNEK